MSLQNVGHHLVGAGRLDDLKQLLASPGWLERKLHSYGTASAVADFRRCELVALPHCCPRVALCTSGVGPTLGPNMKSQSASVWSD